MESSFGKDFYRNYKEAIRREWVITNGLGGYAGSSIIGANTRKHHGLFIASLHAPTERRVLVNRIKETIILNDKEVNLYSGRKIKSGEESGYFYQTMFSMDSVPSFSYFCEGISLEKTVAYEWEKNTVAVQYKIKNMGENAVLVLSPVYNYRDHHAGSTVRNLKFDEGIAEKGIYSLTPKENDSLTIKTFISEGRIISLEEKYDKDIELQTEIDTGMSYRDTGYNPVAFEIGIPTASEKTISLIFSVEDSFCKDASKTIKLAKKRDRELIAKAGLKTDFEKALVVSADKFIVNRDSTHGKTILAGLPWFTDWGRDTMISLTGLTLSTKRFEDCESILRTFVKYEKNGLLPNMFPDENTDPIYNTADASLWFFYCVSKYLENKKDSSADEFVRKELYPCMKKIIAAYRTGTDFSIGMDTDGLVRAGDDFDQVTWMDVRVGERVMTPRHGKPVEINALWYNALCITSSLACEYGDKAYSREIADLSAKVRVSFEKRFWNEAKQCLYDVVDEKSMESGLISDNAQIRPNQIWAVSIQNCPLSEEKARKVVDTVYKKLYTDFGIRTLSEDDSQYHGYYKGDLPARDEAYHQGTAWAYIMGGFITAFLKVYPEKREMAAELLKPLKLHLKDGGIGGIAEVFDGDFPHISGGCYSQAWSVAEILRVISEEKLEV